MELITAKLDISQDGMMGGLNRLMIQRTQLPLKLGLGVRLSLALSNLEIEASVNKRIKADDKKKIDRDRVFYCNIFL